MNSLTRMGIYLAFVITSFLIVSACLPPDMPYFGHPAARITGTPEPVQCDNFAESYWKEFRFGIDSIEDVVATVSRLWEYDETQIDILEPKQEPGILQPHRWVYWVSRDGSAEYYAHFDEGEPLLKVRIFFKRDPTLAQVVECLGFPEYYSAYDIPDIEDALFIIELWYVSRGLVISHNSWYGEHDVSLQPPPPGLVMFIAQAVPPGDHAEMVSAYHYWSNPGQPEYVLCILRPWPGSVEAIEVELTYPELSQCYEPR